MKISVIVPVYNKERYLQTILTQLSQQSMRNFECILVDDGSTDGSGKICDMFAKLDNRFEVFHISNGGVSHARNIALSHAKGEYITFVDADDEIHEDYLKNLYDCMINSGADIVIGSLQKFWDDKEERIEVRYPRTGQALCKKEILRDFAKVQLDTGIFGFCHCKLLSKETIGEIRFDESLKLAEDFAFYLSVYKKTEKFYFDDKAYYYYRQAAVNSTSLIEDSAIDYFSQLKINLKYRSFLQGENVYSSLNKKIVEERINSYVFFVIFYCSAEDMEKKLEALCDFCRENVIDLKGNGVFQSVLLRLLNNKKIYAIKIIICLYRLLRSLKHGK